MIRHAAGIFILVAILAFAGWHGGVTNGITSARMCK